ncbi:MAG: DNA topoisomerase I, partial [Alphaproteobacteria bacterium]|nr:DNA topoisomerase I [Alphaproteobacteria bacterium]
TLPKDEDVLTIGLNRAVTLLAERTPRRGAEPLRLIGDHPDDGEPVVLMDGRYGPYVRHRRLNATLPKGVTPEEVTLEQALTLLAERAAKGKAKGRGKGAKKAGAKGRAKGGKTASGAARGAPSSDAAR